MRSACFLLVAASALVAFETRATAQEAPPACALSAASKGKVAQWKSRDGLRYDHFLPETYDPETGVTVTYVLRSFACEPGNCFWGHPAGRFRPDDLIVGPDPPIRGADGLFDWDASETCLARFHALDAEIRETVKVRATYFVGEWAGGSFALHYATRYPDHVQGVVSTEAHRWGVTDIEKLDVHLAVASLGGVDPCYRIEKDRLPLQLLWRPGPLSQLMDLTEEHWIRCAQLVTWCEAMTSDAPDRLEHDLGWLENVRESDGWQRCPLVAYLVGHRIAGMGSLGEGLRTRAARLEAAVRRVAGVHTAVLRKARLKAPGTSGPPPAWSSHLTYFLRDWRGVPEADALAEEWAEFIDAQNSAAEASRAAYYTALANSDTEGALTAALDAIEHGHVDPWTQKSDMLMKIRFWREGAKALELPRALVKRYDKVVVPAAARRAEGEASYSRSNNSW